MIYGEFEIRLENLRFFSHHGVFEHETRDGNEFEVNLSVKYQSESGDSYSDRIDNTVSYADLFDIIREEMKTPRALMETVAAAIVNNIRDKFRFCTSIECRITKLAPPIAGFIGSASVTYRV